MIEKPIIFSGAMVRAILAGSKTQTRRELKPQPDFRGSASTQTDPQEWGWENDMGHHVPVTNAKLRWQPGDRLWVREQFSGHHQFDELGVSPRHWHRESPIWYWADGNPSHGDWTKPKPSIHMPRWASRITLLVTDVRVHRLQEINEADALAEGAYVGNASGRVADNYAALCVGEWFATGRDWYGDLWNRINGHGDWDANPWVAAVQFTLETTNG